MSKWKTYPLGELIKIQRGHDLPQTEFVEGPYLVAGSNGPIGYHNAYTTKGPSITIGRSGNSIGRVHYYETDFWAHNTTLYAKEFHHTFAKYIYYLFKTAGFASHDSGSAVPSLNRNHIYGETFLIPPLQEQQAIVEVLSSLDDKIVLLKRNNITLQQICETLFRQWFVEYEFPLDDTRTYRASGGKLITSVIGDIPAAWKTSTIAEFISIIETGRRPKGGVGELSYGVPSIGAENVKSLGVYNYAKTKYISEEYYQKMNAGKLQNRDILVYKDGGVPGTFIPHLTMVGEGFPYKTMAINEHVFRLVAKESYCQNYLFFWLTTDYIMGELAERGTGAAIPGINSTQMKEIPILLPENNLVKKFDALVEPLIKKILANGTQINNLSALRDTLLPKLMSGKVCVEQTKV